MNIDTLLVRLLGRIHESRFPVISNTSLVTSRSLFTLLLITLLALTGEKFAAIETHAADEPTEPRRLKRLRSTPLTSPKSAWAPNKKGTNKAPSRQCTISSHARFIRLSGKTIMNSKLSWPSASGFPLRRESAAPEAELGRAYGLIQY